MLSLKHGYTGITFIRYNRLHISLAKDGIHGLYRNQTLAARQTL